MSDIPLLTQTLGKDFRSAQFENLAGVVLAPATLTILGEIPTGGDGGPVMIAITNAGANPLTLFEIGAIPTPNTVEAGGGAGNLFPTILTSAQLNTGTGIADLLIGVSENPTTLAAGHTAVIMVKANGAWRLQARATSTLGTTIKITAAVARST